MIALGIEEESHSDTIFVGERGLGTESPTLFWEAPK